MSIIHRVANFPSTIEYLLEDDDDLEALQEQALHPWVSQLLGLSEAEIIERLRQRWHGLAYDGPQQLRNVILQCHPRSIAIHEDEAFLVLRWPEPTESGPRALPFLLPPPASPDEVTRVVTDDGFGDNLVLVELMEAFGGLSESMLVGEGRFVRPEEMHKRVLRQEKWVPAEGWAGSLVLLNTRAGDVILLHQQGQVAYFLHELNELQDLGMDLDKFLSRYARWRKDGTPFEH